jgi:hypothetical protein
MQIKGQWIEILSTTATEFYLKLCTKAYTELNFKGVCAF